MFGSCVERLHHHTGSISWWEIKADPAESRPDSAGSKLTKTLLKPESSKEQREKNNQDERKGRWQQDKRAQTEENHKNRRRNSLDERKEAGLCLRGGGAAVRPAFDADKQ